jgi:hypothetical protein
LRTLLVLQRIHKGRIKHHKKRKHQGKKGHQQVPFCTILFRIRKGQDRGPSIEEDGRRIKEIKRGKYRGDGAVAPTPMRSCKF